jgi:hypothetical protein
MKKRPTGATQQPHLLRTTPIRTALLLIATAITFPFHAAEKAEIKPATPQLIAEEKDGCSKNLKAIYAAIEGYRRANKDLPNWFADLVPDYLPDVNVLICPVSRRTGRVDAPQLSDPRIASSYLFEFCPLPLGANAPANPKVTRREWKRKQMGVVGSVVPLVRCRLHPTALNLSFDGRVYESPPAWESMLTNMVDPETLTPARMFPATDAPAKAAAAKKIFPARDTNATPRLLDLTPFYNARLTDTWHGEPNAAGNDLASLPTGVQNIGGVEYDVRGVVQLGSKAPTANRFPTNALGIKVRQKCRKLHFLHSAAFGRPSDDGKQIGVYVLRFAANQMRLEVPIVYGKDVRDWHYWAAEKEAAPGLKMAWKGENVTSKAANSYIRLFETTWTNLVPDIEIESIDFVSNLSQPAPFLIAISLE